ALVTKVAPTGKLLVGGERPPASRPPARVIACEQVMRANIAAAYGVGGHPQEAATTSDRLPVGIIDGHP
ncbi:hypothetical protein BHM03_00014937, partial [Ensete ventricosum]